MKIVSALLAVLCALFVGAVLAVTPCACAPPAHGEPTLEAEAEIRALIADWYAELLAEGNGHPYRLMAPGFVQTARPYEHIDTGAASLGPRIYTSLAARALQFQYEIEHLKIDPRFAKARVWERGYFFAWAAQRTYETAAATTFILERQEKDGRWLILAHDTGSQGIPPTKKTDPMPDLRDLFYATEGKHRDPAADARAARGE